MMANLSLISFSLNISLTVIKFASILIKVNLTQITCETILEAKFVHICYLTICLTPIQCAIVVVVRCPSRSNTRLEIMCRMSQSEIIIIIFSTPEVATCISDNLAN